MAERRPPFARWVFWQICLYVLASPIYLVRFLLRGLRHAMGFSRARHGEILCPHCGTPNPMDVLATCRRCGVTEFGSRVYCSNCHQVTNGFPCSACRALIRVF